MAFTITPTKTTVSTANALSYASGNYTALAGEYLIVFVAASGTVASGSCSGTATFTRIGTESYNGTGTLYAFVSSTITSSSSAHNVTFSCSGDSATGAAINVIRIRPDFEGTVRSGIGAVVQYQTTTGTATNIPELEFLNTTNTNNIVMLAIANNTNPAGLAISAPFTEHYDIGYNTPSTGLWCASAPNGHGALIAYTDTASASNYGIIGIELDTSPLVTSAATAFFNFF